MYIIFARWGQDTREDRNPRITVIVNIPDLFFMPMVAFTIVALHPRKRRMEEKFALPRTIKPLFGHF